jgi:FkbH-like protein
MTMRLRDRFADHGLISVLIAERRGEDLEIDTWLMSCRVIGRKAEDHLFARLCGRSRSMGCRRIVGTYIPTAKNVLVKDLFCNLGFAHQSSDDASEVWSYDLAAWVQKADEFIRDGSAEVQ